MLEKFNLLGNPFEMKTVHDINDFSSLPFLMLRTQRLLKQKLEINKNSPFPIYHILLGERGSGKSSTLLFLSQLFNNGNENILSLYTNKIITQINQLYNLLNIPYLKKEQITLNMVESYIKEKKIYLFIDVQDRVSPKDLNEFLGILEKLLDYKNISIVIAINRVYYNNSFSHSELFGKYTTSELEPFDYDETEELIKERIIKYKKNINEEDIPFTRDSIKNIYSFSGGIPRNILSACDLLLLGANEKNINLIDETFTKKILQNDYAYKIINERIKEDSKREVLIQLYEIIKSNFNGFVKQEKELNDYIYNNKGWANMTTRKRVRELKRIGLIEISKNKSNLWSNQIIIRG